MQRGLFIVKPEAMDHRHEIRHLIEKSGLTIISSKVSLPPTRVLDEIYRDVSPELREQIVTYMKAKVCEFGVVEGKEALNTLVALGGEYSNPSRCDSKSIRSRFGSADINTDHGPGFFMNGFHRSQSPEEAKREVDLYYSALVFPTVRAKVIEIVKQTCTEEERWKLHIYPVVLYGQMLARKFNADIEVVELAAWLHDITRITGDIENHHISGMAKADRILSDLGYCREKIAHIKRCIFAHRGSVIVEKETIEEEIVCCADAMSHFEYRIVLFYSAFGRKKLSLDSGADWIRAKVNRSWNKITIPFAQELVKSKYEAMMDILTYTGDFELDDFTRNIGEQQ